jgi:hypothetical protein
MKSQKLSPANLTALLVDDIFICEVLSKKKAKIERIKKKV